MSTAECHKEVELRGDAQKFGLARSPQRVLDGEPVGGGVAREVAEVKLGDQLSQSVA